MILERSERYLRSYRRLNEGEKEHVRKALRLLARDLRHPSLHVKKMKGVGGVWEVRASRDLRITFEVTQGVALLRNVGHHDTTLRSP